MTRQRVFEALAERTTPSNDRTVTARILSRDLQLEESVVRTHLCALVDCELAVRVTDVEFRASQTGAELYDLDLDDMVVIDDRCDDAAR